MAVGIFCRVRDWNANKVVSSAQMETYGKTFLRRYEDLVQSKVLPAYQKYFQFLKEKPILIKASVSTSHGAAVEFVPSEVRNFQCRTVTDRIEREIFPDKDLNISKVGGYTSNFPVRIYSGKPGPMFSVPAKFVGLRNLVFVTNKGWFVNILETGSLRTKGIVVDDINYPNMLRIKGSNLRNVWNRKTAKEEALYDFHGDFSFAYFSSEEFREFVATPVLTQIAKKIEAKQSAGKYGGEYGWLEMKEDLDELNAAADAHGIKHEFSNNLYEFVKSQPQWREKHPIKFNVMCGVVGGFLLILLILFFKLGWKWILVKLRH